VLLFPIPSSDAMTYTGLTRTVLGGDGNLNSDPEKTRNATQRSATSTPPATSLPTHPRTLIGVIFFYYYTLHSHFSRQGTPTPLGLGCGDRRRLCSSLSLGGTGTPTRRGALKQRHPRSSVLCVTRRGRTRTSRLTLTRCCRFYDAREARQHRQRCRRWRCRG
jgi:hypothetical protein